MPIKIDFFESFAKEIEGKFRRVSHLLKKANLKSGEYHESIIRSSLSNFLSKRFSVKTGYIWLDNEKQSKQIDILIIDENCPFAYLFQANDFVIVRPEAVVAVIEVKTVLKEDQFKESFENIFIAKQLKKEALGYYGHIFGAVFGYISNKKIDNNLLDKWFRGEAIAKYDKEVEALWPNIFSFFKNNLTLLLDENHRLDKKTGPAHYYEIFREKDNNPKAWRLSLFICMIVSMCEGTSNSGLGVLKPLKALSMVDLEGAMAGVNAFRPREGHSTRTI